MTISFFSRYSHLTCRLQRFYFLLLVFFRPMRWPMGYSENRYAVYLINVVDKTTCNFCVLLPTHVAPRHSFWRNEHLHLFVVTVISGLFLETCHLDLMTNWYAFVSEVLSRKITPRYSELRIFLETLESLTCVCSCNSCFIIFLTLSLWKNTTRQD